MNDALTGARDRPHRFGQLYGYAVCLTAVIVALISGNNVVNAAFDLAAPLHAARWGGGRELPASFEEYRAERRGFLKNEREAPAGKEPVVPVIALTDEELRRIYDANRADMARRQRFRAARSLAASLLLLAASIGLFVWHWRWMRSLGDAGAARSGSGRTTP